MLLKVSRRTFKCRIRRKGAVTKAPRIYEVLWFEFCYVRGCNYPAAFEKLGEF